MSDAQDLEEWVTRMLPREPVHVRDNKAIHDPVLGTNVFSPHEIALLDTPLLQRLRYISQTGFAYLTFPGARHTRFEHTLGAATLVERYSRLPDIGLTPQEYVELRIAALLHDCGHAFFSHSSEDIFARLPFFREMRRVHQAFQEKGAGELLSYAIVTSASFRRYFAALREQYGLVADLDHIAGFILGYPANPSRPFVAEIISGPFDVDKLDYIHRDAHATGLRLVVDLDRFFYAITVRTIDGRGRRLAIRAPEPLEQLIFSKMLLFATVYHHHKVKACDCLLKGAVDWARHNNATISGETLDTPASFLALTDIELLAEKSNPLIQRLKNRSLLYRACAISLDTVEGWAAEGKTPVGIFQLRKDTSSPGQVNGLNRAVYDTLPERVRSQIWPEEIWVDIPEQPHLNELALASIAGPEQTIEAEKCFPTEGWLNAYGTFRSRGHVFAPREYVTEVFAATAEVIESRYRLTFRPREVKAVCHW